MHIKFHKNKKSFFYFADIDDHYLLQLFCLFQVKIKHKTKFKAQRPVSFGLNVNQREEKLIVSLTSYPARIHLAHKAIASLLNQELRPDKVILWLAKEQFPNRENDLPSELLILKEFGLSINWCDDLKSYKKLIPALKEYPNDTIITADDDIYYPKDWLKSLYETHLKNPTSIISRRVCRVFFDAGNLRISSINIKKIKDKKASFLNQILGGTGVLYPPNSLDENIFNIENIKTLIPTHDDIYFWAMALLKGTKISIVDDKYDCNIYYVEDSQDSGLCKINKAQSTGLSRNEAFQRLFEKYPQILDLLKNDNDE